MPGGIGPLLLTGVAVVGTAAVVASPILPPPTDIRMSASDLTADGQPLDVLQPDFLKTVDANERGWRNPLKVLDDMMSGFIVDRSEAENLRTLDEVLSPANSGAGVGGRAGQPISTVLSNQVASVPDVTGDTLGLGPTLDSEADLAGPFTDLTERLPAPQQVLDDVLGALADIGSRFGAAGEAFIGQLGLTPGAATELAAAGPLNLSPLERLRDLVLQPLTLATDRDDDREDRLDFERLLPIALLRAIIDALVQTLPAPIGQPDGIIDTLDRGINDLTAEIRDALRPNPSAPQDDAPEVTADSDPTDLRHATSDIASSSQQRNVGTDTHDDDEKPDSETKLTLIITDDTTSSDSSPRDLRDSRSNTGVATAPSAEPSDATTAPSATPTAPRTSTPSTVPGSDTTPDDAPGSATADLTGDDSDDD